jgi:glycogen operon protein
MPYDLEHKTKRRISEGKYYPLGATVCEEGVNFAIYSQYADQVYLLLFGRSEGEPTDVIKLENRTKYIWYTFVHGLKAGQLYGYKVKGEFRLAYGLRFNDNKLLIDPHAKALTGKFKNTDNLLLAYDPNSPVRDLSKDRRDNTSLVPKSIVV